LFTDIRNVFGTKHILISAQKVVKKFQLIFLHMYYSDCSDIWKFVLHGTVVTQLKCGGIFNNCFIANCPENVTVEKFWKSANFWRRYGPRKSDAYFGTECNPRGFVVNVGRLDWSLPATVTTPR